MSLFEVLEEIGKSHLECTLPKRVFWVLSLLDGHNAGYLECTNDEEPSTETEEMTQYRRTEKFPQAHIQKMN